MVNTTDAWIRERTGIEKRHIAASDETTCTLAEHAARRAMESAGVGADDVDLIIVATTTPDKIFPSTACLLQQRLGIRGIPAFDLQAVCTGFIYALSVEDKFIQTGSAKCVLVIGAETMSRIVDWTDRRTCVVRRDSNVITVFPGKISGIFEAERMVKRQLRRIGKHADSDKWIEDDLMHDEGIVGLTA